MHSTSEALFRRRYWPTGAIIGLIVCWLIAGYAYTNANTTLTGAKDLPPGVYIAAALGIACIFVRRTREMRLTFERRQHGTYVRASGDASWWVIKQLRIVAVEGPNPEALGEELAEGTPPQRDSVGRLAQLADLRDRGVLTPTEFEQQKARILDH